MSIDFGLMRDKITIQAQSVIRDDNGGDVVTWVTFAQCWASKRTPASREVFASEQRIGISSVIFTTRSIANVTQKMRVIDRDNVQYGITGILYPEYTGQRMDIISERINDGI